MSRPIYAGLCLIKSPSNAEWVLLFSLSRTMTASGVSTEGSTLQAQSIPSAIVSWRTLATWIPVLAARCRPRRQALCESGNRIRPVVECPVVIALAADDACQCTAEIAIPPEALEHMAKVVLRLPVQL